MMFFVCFWMSFDCVRFGFDGVLQIPDLQNKSPLSYNFLCVGEQIGKIIQTQYDLFSKTIFSCSINKVLNHFYVLTCAHQISHNCG